MGVPKLLKKLKTDCKYIESGDKYLKETCFDKNITRMYIDFAFVISIVLEENPELNDETVEVNKIVISKTIDKLKELFKIGAVNCEKHIYFESVASTAKLNEKVNRRMCMMLKKEVENNLREILDYKDEEPDKSNLVGKSFGSEYINELIHTISKEKITQLYFHKYDQYNPDENKGEAEHRILNHIKKSRIKTNDIFYICTSDSDLILISLILTNNLGRAIKGFKVNTMIYEKIQKKFNLLYFDSKKYLEYLNKLFVGIDDNKIFKYINDLIFCMNILGNDFIPGLHKSSAFDLNKIISYLKKQEKNIIFKFKEKYYIDKYCLTNFLLQFKSNKNEYDCESLKTIKIPDKNYLTDNYRKILYNLLLEQQFTYGNYIYQSCFNDNSGKFGIDSIDKTFNKLKKIREIIITDPIVFKLSDKSDKPDKPDNSSDSGSVSNGDNLNSYPIYKINVNNSRYNSVDILKRDNNMFVEEITEKDKDSRAKNYLEGLDFILDMYFNSIESPPNYFWFYKYTKAPSLDEISNYLITNEISSHKENLPSDFDYLTREEYKSYMNCACDKNINEIKKIYGQITYDNLTSVNHNRRIMFSHGVNHVSEFYPKYKYYLDPIEWKLNKNAKFDICVFNYVVSMRFN
jgi:hypothetical protein